MEQGIVDTIKNTREEYAPISYVRVSWVSVACVCTESDLKRFNDIIPLSVACVWKRCRNGVEWQLLSFGSYCTKPCDNSQNYSFLRYSQFVEQ